MPTLDLLIAFLSAAAIFAYMPGPSTLYTATQTIARGQQAGWFAALGIHVGGYVHVLVAAFGLSILFDTLPLLYPMLKYLGAVYLVWLGIRMFTAAPVQSADVTSGRIDKSLRVFWQSASVEILNPKTAIFYIAFLPQFTDPSVVFPVWLQLFVLGTIVNLMFSSADAICVVLAGRIMALVQEVTTGARLAQRVGGGALVGLGIYLGFDIS